MMTLQYKHFPSLRTHKLHQDNNCTASELDFCTVQIEHHKKKGSIGLKPKDCLKKIILLRFARVYILLI